MGMAGVRALVSPKKMVRDVMRLMMEEYGHLLDKDKASILEGRSRFLDGEIREETSRARLECKKNPKCIIVKQGACRTDCHDHDLRE